MDKMEEAPGLPVTRSQPWPAPAPGSQVTSNNGAKPGASLTHLLAGAGLNGNNITMVSDQRERGLLVINNTRSVFREGASSGRISTNNTITLKCIARRLN